MALEHELNAEAVDRLRIVIGKLGRQLRPTGAGAQLTPTQISVLFTIVRQGPLGMAQLAETEGLNPTMLSRVTALLAEAGLIERAPDPSDRRAATVSATPAGTTLRKRIHKERTDALRAHLDHLDAEQRRAVRDALPVLEALADDLKRRRA